MPILEQVVLCNREAQTSDTAIFRKDLPKQGCYSALDVGIRVTNGATSNIDSNILSIIKKLSLVVNGNDYRFHLSGNAAFRWQWAKFGRPMYYNWTEAASGVNEVWFRIPFGRYMGDKVYGLDASRFNNVQLQVDYGLSEIGAVAVTTTTTGTFAVTAILHQFPFAARPAFRGMFGAREFWTGTSVASGEETEELPSANAVMAVCVQATEDNVAAATDVTQIKIGKDNFSTIWLNQYWYNLASQQSHGLSVREEVYQLLLSSAATRKCHLENISTVNLQPLAATAGVA